MAEPFSERTESIFYKAFDSSINIIMAISDIEDGVYVDVNEAFLRVTGCGRNDVIGRSSVDVSIVSPDVRGRMRRILDEKGKVEDFEIDFLSRDGRFISLKLFAEIILIDGERRLFTIGHDITELTSAQSALAREESVIKAIFDSTDDAYVLKDMNSVYQKANQAFCDFFGVAPLRISGKTDFDFFTNDEAKSFRLEDMEVMSKGRRIEYERRYEATECLNWYQVTKTPVRDTAGEVCGVLCAVRDITRKKRLDDLLASRLSISNYSFSCSLQDLFEKILSESEKLTFSPISFFHFVDDEKRIRLVKWSEKSMFACKIKEYDDAYSLEGAGVWADCLRRREPVIHNDYHNEESRRGLPDGHVPIARELVVPVFEGERIVAILGVGNKPTFYDQTDVEIAVELAKMAWDILTRKKAEDDLKESRRALNTLVNNLPGTVFRCRITREWEMEYMSYGCLGLTGYEPEDLISAKTITFGQIILDEDRERVWNEICAYMANSNHYEIEYRIKTRDSSIKWVCERGAFIPSEDGSISYIEGFITDITESKQKDNELKRFVSAIHQVAEAIVITDAEGIIRYVNPSFERISEYSRSEVIGKNIKILDSGEQGQQFREDLWETISSGRRWTGRFINKKRGGSLYTEEATITPVTDNEGRITEYVSVKRDISNELAMEEKLAQAQKMEAIGTLAGGIAHDFNNILFPLMGYAEILQQDLPEESQLQDYVSEILTASIRAKDLVGQILTFSRQSKYEKTIVRVQSVLNEVVKFSKSILPSTISVKTFINKNCRPVMADATQIHQVAMNLITNSLHAMEGSCGIITIELDEVLLDFVSANNLSLKQGLHIRMAVTDTGCGMDEHIMEKVFDPYFTTKENGKGTGIGLSVVHGIVSSNGGTIDLKSSPGIGTSIAIYFPCVMDDRSGSKKESASIAQTGNERILVVDDEESIARMTRQYLERLGYSVTVRTSSLEAYQLLKDDPDRFDLLFTDMTMPRMTGDILASEVKKLRKKMPVIICTGFSEKMNEERAREIGIEGFLIKPVLQSDLAAVVRRVLDAQK